MDIIVPSRFHEDLLKSGIRNKCESGAWLLFSQVTIGQDPWTKTPRRKFILRQVIPFSGADIVSASTGHLTIKTASFVPVMKKAKEGLIPGFFHGHPSGFDQFSPMDNENERNLLQAVQNRNGNTSQLISMLVLPDGDLLARCWSTEDDCEKCEVSLSGASLRTFAKFHEPTEVKQQFDRQIRLFGESFSFALQNLKVLVVGAGGTGSSVAVMLARAGVGNIAIIDHDTIELTNLHRLHGARRCDIGKSKAVSLAHFINEIGFDSTVVGIRGNILQPEHQDLLKSADVIFSAMDGHAGRLLLNRFAYYYETPVIDMGLATVKSPDGLIKDLTGRVTILHPGSACLICRGIVDSQLAREEALEWKDPKLYKSQLKEGYIQGGGDPEPAFVSMTTSVATMAVEELIQLILGFRKMDRNITQRFRCFEIPKDLCVSVVSKSDCQICGLTDCWGLGDVVPFLGRIP